MGVGATHGADGRGSLVEAAAWEEGECSLGHLGCELGGILTHRCETWSSKFLLTEGLLEEPVLLLKNLCPQVQLSSEMSPDPWEGSLRT